MSDQPAALPTPPPVSGGGLPLGPPSGRPLVPEPPPAPPAPTGPEVIELEMRDHLGASLADAATELTKQVLMLSADEDPGKCKDMAQACLYLTEALVLVAPIESTGQTGGPGGEPVPLPPKHMPPQASLNTAEQQATGRPS